MASKTSFLQMILPLNGEYQDTWDQVANANFQKLDDWASGVDSEIVDARFGQASLKEFLQVGLNNDGSLKPAPEVVKSRNSFLYGDEILTNDLDLSARLNLGDKEVFWAREGRPSLREALGAHTYMQGAVIDGSKDANGYPTWLGFTGANANVDGSVTNIILQIGGQRARVRTLEQVVISGSVGTKYIWAQVEANGVERVDGDSTSAPPASANGACGNTLLDSKVRYFKDLTTDFTTKDVKAGDILEIIGNNSNAGQYIIAEVAPGGDVNSLKIYGIFPGGALSSLNYTVTDPFAVTLGFDATKTPASGKLYIGEVDFDGSAITAARELHFNDYFVGAWQAVDVTSTPQFTLTWDHNLFDDKLEVVVQASQTNDGLQPIVPLDMGSLTNTTALNFSNTLLFNAGNFNPGSSGATYSPGPTLTGNVTSSLTGSVLLDNAVRVQFTRTQISVKNPVAGVFYKDFSGTAKTAGYVRVIVRRKA